MTDTPTRDAGPVTAPDLHKHWAVTVETSGERIVRLETECYGGREISNADEAAIRTAAQHLLAFIGDPFPAADLCRAPVAQDAEPVSWPAGFFELRGDARLRECDTDGCYQHCSIRMERGGVGSDYCEPCARKIATPQPSDEAATLRAQLAEARAALAAAEAHANALADGIECALAICGTPIARRRLNLDPSDERLKEATTALAAHKDRRAGK